MNDNQGNGLQASKSDGQPGTVASPARSSCWRVVLRVTAATILGFFAVATVYQMLYSPTLPDGGYEWTLRWPGIPPGARFKTEPGDDVRWLLDALMVDAGANWEDPLAESGSIEVQLSHPAYPSLWTILKWRFGLLKASQGLMAERTRLVVRMNLTSQQPARYEVVRLAPGDDAVTTGTFNSFPEAQSAVLDELAQAMEGS